MTLLPFRRSHPTPTLPDAHVIALVRLLSTALEAGAPPATVLTSLSRVQPVEPAPPRRWLRSTANTPLTTARHRVVASLARTATRGAPLGPVWESCAQSLRSEALALVANVWTLSDRTGAPPASALRAGAQMLQAQAEQRRHVDAAAAGAMATRNLLTFLPAAGPVFAVALGLSVTEVYGNATAVVAVLVGLLFLVLGRRWVDVLIRRALGPSSTRYALPQETTPLAVAQATDLLVLTLRAGTPVVDALTMVAGVLTGPASQDLQRVAAAYQWGFSDAAAWSAAPPAWSPLATALAVARDTGIPVAALWAAAANDLRTEVDHERTVAAARLGTHLVLPLGLTFLPAFMATTLIPLVLSLARTAAL